MEHIYIYIYNTYLFLWQKGRLNRGGVLTPLFGAGPKGTRFATGASIAPAPGSERHLEQLQRGEATQPADPELHFHF